MSSRGPYRRHAAQFKLQLCVEIRSGALGRRGARSIRGRGLEAKIAAFERKVGQLTMELDLVKKTPRLRLVRDNENSSIISCPKAAPSDGGVK